VFCARWPDGSLSVVEADDEIQARIQLDELGEDPAQLSYAAANSKEART
jgi:hypothetical protein